MNIIVKHGDLPIGVIGDIHRDFDALRNKIKLYNLENFIGFICGDFGVGFRHNIPGELAKEQRRLRNLNIFLKKRNIFIYVIAGNHDNPSFFNGSHNFTNLIFMQNYDVVEVGEHKVLGIGGAISVDRKPNYHFKDYRGHDYTGRKEGVDWWTNEKVVFDEEKLASMSGIDILITHTCPDFAYPPVLGGQVWKWCDCDPELKDELIQERELMSKIYNKLMESNNILHVYYGHFHSTNTEIHGTTKFHLLDIGEFQEVRI